MILLHDKLGVILEQQIMCYVDDIIINSCNTVYKTH